MNKRDVVIIGAGPAGIMAAITASQQGRRVMLVDRNPQIGRKLLSTGNGRCNLTNAELSIDRFHGASPDFIAAVLGQFDQNAAMDFFRSLGLLLKQEDNGRIFPRTNQASSVVEVLRQRLRANRVEVALDTQVKSIDRDSSWRIGLIDGRSFEAIDLIIATGGRAAHQLGSTGDGLFWARNLGHSLTPMFAALVPIETVETWPKEVAGVKIEVRLQGISKGGVIGESTGDLLFTSYGVSGTAAMALARPVAAALANDPVSLNIDMFSDLTTSQLDSLLSDVLANAANTSLGEAMIGIMPSTLIEIVCKLAELHCAQKATQVTDKQRAQLTGVMKNLTLTVAKLRPYKEAQVTAGGVNCSEIDPQTMGSKLQKNLYFAGEIVDVDADSGGFNLQWAWSSGRVAGRLGKSNEMATA